MYDADVPRYGTCSCQVRWHVLSETFWACILSTVKLIHLLTTFWPTKKSPLPHWQAHPGQGIGSCSIFLVWQPTPPCKRRYARHSPFNSVLGLAFVACMDWCRSEDREVSNDDSLPLSSFIRHFSIRSFTFSVASGAFVQDAIRKPCDGLVLPCYHLSMRPLPLSVIAHSPYTVKEACTASSDSSFASSKMLREP